MANTLLYTIQVELESELKRIGVYSKYADRIPNVLENEKECQEVINLILNNDVYHSENQHTIGVTQERAKHILMTYLLGKCFLKFENFEQRIIEPRKYGLNYTKNAWMMTALYHDCGYYNEDLKNNTIDLYKFTPYLLEMAKLQSNKLCNLHYKIDEIEAYDRYVRTYHEKRNDAEKIDHGILGGVWAYEKLLKTSQYFSWDELEIQEICITIVQHNIFKSNNVNTDKEYQAYGLDRLASTSALKIQSSTPLLLFLSLVDTVECIKKFGRRENKQQYLNTKTVLKNLKVTVSQEKIIVDLDSLKQYIDKNKGKRADKYLESKRTANEGNNLKGVYEEYTDALKNFSTWTTLNCRNLGSECYEITLQS